MHFNIVNALFVKPLDVEFLKTLTSEHIVTIEDNVALGGFGAMVNNEILKLGKNVTIKNFAYKDEFIPQGSVSLLQEKFGVNVSDIESYILNKTL